MNTPKEIPAEIEDYLSKMITSPVFTYSLMARAVKTKFGQECGLTAADIATFFGDTKKGAPFLNQLYRDRELAEWLRQNQTTGSIDEIRNACIEQFGESRVPSRSTVAGFLKSEGRKGRLGDKDFFSDKPEVASWLLAEYPKYRNDELRKLCLEKFGKERTPSRSSLQRFLCQHQKTTTIRRHGIWLDEELGAWLRKNAPLLRMADLHAESVKRFGRERVGSKGSVCRFLASQKDRHLTRYKSRKEVEDGLRRFHAENQTEQDEGR